ncbi:MAG: hypothetical protein D8M57_09565 [Candidatus Scalindua sp. AMX11]|nr:MAG: hypothetical protein DWQ00_01065 [Candidatus Scalindua sp.]NOG82611.1 hypothetical protein [Planctomycetota bacterium]RZV78314.1 MAG: hypothetical protein EX341_11340 [Candidatus Scalindua sp. SCAELEC01]TDE65137.1 MAG: hypothetical protein D8M57_09565 [Candidatus Scalindua sp. AMX11]GJQ59512.1 MAG: hypothetical protein SCALA701_23130 [Candidatus Scalindua sp.]
MDSAKMLSTMEGICNQHGWHLGVFYLLEDDRLNCAGQETCIKNPHLRAYQEECKKYKFKKGVGVPGRVWQNQNYEWVNNVQNLDVSEYPRAAPAKTMGIKASLGVPYKQDGNFMGVMEFFNINKVECDSAMVQDIMKKCGG